MYDPVTWHALCIGPVHNGKQSVLARNSFELCIIEYWNTIPPPTPFPTFNLPISLLLPSPSSVISALPLSLSSLSLFLSLSLPPPPSSPQGEEPPAGYKVLKSLDLGKGLMGPSLFLCYCTNLVHPSSVPYTPELLPVLQLESGKCWQTYQEILGTFIATTAAAADAH